MSPLWLAPSPGLAAAGSLETESAGFLSGITDTFIPTRSLRIPSTAEVGHPHPHPQCPQITCV